jgi:FtsH-binding integral membrane protein
MGGAIAVKSGIAEQMLYWGWFPRIALLVAWMGAPFLLQKIRHVPTWNVVGFALYGLFTGIVLSTIIWLAIFMAERNGAHGGTYLFQAGGLTLLAFGAISAYAFVSKRDFSFLRGFLMVGSIVLIGALLVGFFVESTALQLVISVFGVLLMSAFVLYDTQKVLKTFPDGEHVAGAMTLYLDFVVLFIYILRLVLLLAGGGRRD